MIEALIAIIGLGVGDFADPLNLSAEDKDKQVIMQELCEETTTTDERGQSYVTKLCKSMKTINTNEEKD